MTISLHHLIPIPLKDKITSTSSDIWNKELIFSTGEKIKVRAPSGTGKTTLVHLLYNMRSDYGGAIFYDNTNISDVHSDTLSNYRQQKISIIFQDLRLFEHLTIKENLELKRIMYKPIYNEEVIYNMAEQLSITHILDQPAALCSYGEQQRAAIIRSLLQPFDWLIMDEPFSHLDIANTAKVAQLIAEECAKREAGFILTDLDDDQHFAYDRTLNL